MEPIVLARANGPIPRVSVAVSTRNRCALLGRLIESLERQIIPAEEFEVVIVDDASDDGTAEVVADLAARSTVRLTAARLPMQSGPAVGRNVAWRLARGEFVAFTDDDCQPTPAWLEHGLAALEHLDVVVGRVEPDPAQRLQMGPFSRTMHVTDERYLATCNIFYRRRDLDTVGGFDEGFPGWAAGGEDTDLGWRVRERLGRSVGFSQDALVLHDVRPSRFRSKVRETLRWTGIARLVALHPEEGRRALHRRYFWRDTHPKAILAVVGLALTPRFPIAAVLVAPWLRMRMERIGSRRYIAALPGLLVIDALEVAVMIRGSIQNRTLVL